MDNIEEQLKKLYKKNSDDPNHMADNYFYIIQIKKLNPKYIEYVQPLYIDIKFFIELYIKSRSKRDFGYDVIDINKVIEAIYSLDVANERLALLNWAYRDLKFNQFEEEAEKLISSIRKEKFITFWNRGDYFRLTSHLISYNLIVVITLLIIAFIICYILLLPSYNPSWSIIEFRYISFSENFYLNHLFNLLDHLLGISEDITIKPLNWKGVLLLSAMKLFYIIFIVNYLFKIITERFQLNR